MRKVGTSDLESKKRKRSVAILSFFMLAILLFGTVGYAFSFYVSGGNSVDNQDQVVYEGQDKIYTFSRSEVSDIAVVIDNTYVNYQNYPLYVISNNSLISGEIYNAFQGVSSRVQEACLGDCDKDLPELDCSDGRNVIVFEESDESTVYQEDNCIFIEGSLKSVDAFLYRIFDF